MAPSRLRIGIDAHAIGERQTGNERFVRGLIPALRDLCDHDLVLYFTDRAAAEAWPAGERTRVRVLAPAHPVVRIPVVLPARAARDRVDVLLVQYTAPPVLRRPVVTVVHDVAFARFPAFFTPAERLWMRRTIPFTMRRAAGIVTVSNFSKEEIVRVLGLPPERVTVAYDGVDPVFARAPDAPPSVDPPFFLAVGNLQPRKNLVTLVEAYSRALEQAPGLRERLVLVGKEVYRADPLHARAEDLVRSGRAVFTGYLSDDELVALMRHATAFAYPSVYEGFGLPPVEAMAAGVPALVSDIPVMREVVGDAALRLPPTDAAAWASALLRVAADEALRARLVERGLERASRYTWEGCAAAVLPVLERAARGG